MNRVSGRACVAILAGVLPVAAGESRPAPDWPEAWRAAWTNPPADCRPLQIVHSLEPRQATPEALARFRAAGLGGFVCNVHFDDYLVSETRWADLKQILEHCRQAGLVVWLYDEKGYPSGAAGGRVLDLSAAFQAQALVFDPSQADPFAIRPAFEHTHASNNYFACRRYVNLIDAAAVRCFIDLTHAAYARRLEPYFGSTVRAFFTDEPSLMAVNIGQLPEPARAKVPVVDPVDPDVRALPMVPWSSDLTDLYRRRYQADLSADRRSLFEGDGDRDRRVRTRYWSLIADLVADRYFGQIQAFCRSHGVASSGHILHEENLIAQVPLVGNPLKALSRMDVPGLDVLTSRPRAVVDGMWLTASLPVSAALLNGRRLVMTEVSDFVERMATGQRAPLEAMQATAAWQAALGVTEFTLYYDTIWRLCDQLPEDELRRQGSAYGDTVGRLNAVLRDARPVHRVLLYYPIADLWAEYRPRAEALSLEAQSPRARQIVASFMRLGRQMLTQQIPFLLADHELLARAVPDGGRLTLAGRSFDALVVPAGAKIPEASGGIGAFAGQGGIVLHDAPDGPGPDLSRLAARDPAGRLDPACADIVLGRFERAGRQILLLVNVGTAPYNGSVGVGDIRAWRLADPATGRLQGVAASPAGRAPVRLPAGTATILISDG